MRILLPVLLLTLLSLSCREKNPANYYWVSFHGNNYEKSDTINILEVIKSQNGDTTFFSYNTAKGKKSYTILGNKDSSILKSDIKGVLLNPTDSIAFMRNFHDTLILLQNDTFSVKQFVLNEFVIDGASVKYYNPTFGIYAEHSSFWPGIRYLQTTDSILNNKLKLLIKATVPIKFIKNEI